MQPALRRRRRRAAAAVAAVVLAAHALLLLVLLPGWFEFEEPPHPAAPALRVRSIVVAAPPSAEPAAVPAPTSPTAAGPARAAAPTRAPRPSSHAASSLTQAPQADARSREAEPGAEATAAVSVVEASEPSAPAAVELPVYATRLSPPGSWRYLLQRGPASGEALLEWQPTADGRYALRLEGRIAGLTVMDWASRGAIDAAGIAPERFALRRRGRDREAANFQRDAAKITFSGPTHELPLLPGVQDRLSWLMQLAAIVDAAPQRFAVGGEPVLLMVVGARGGTALWSFSAVGAEPVDGLPALKLLREARHERQTQVEVWLDPAQHHLPLRVRLTQAEGGTALELRRLSRTEGSTAP